MGNPYLEVSNQLAENLVSSFNLSVPSWAAVLFLAVIVWSTIWKLLGLWKSARKGSVIWFVLLAVTNTLGILSILYIYVFSEIGKKKTAEKKEDRSGKRKRKR